MRELYLDNGSSEFKFADTTTQIRLNALDDGYLASLTANAKVRIKNDSGYLLEVGASVTKNQAVITSGQLAQLPAGNYLIELWDTTANGGTAIYPSDGFLRLQINENTTGISGGIISSITVDDFAKQFSELSQQLKRQVSDGVAKGVKGDPGVGFEFFPSTDGLPNYSTIDHTLDFRCVEDQAQITFPDGSSAKIPNNTVVDVEFGDYTSSLIVFDTETMTVMSKSPYVKRNAKQYVLASVRRYPNAGKKLTWSGVLAPNLLIDGKNYMRHSVIYQQSPWCRLTFSDETGLDFGVVEGHPQPYVYLDGDENPVVIPVGTKAVFDSRTPDYRGSWKVTWKVGTSNAILTPWNLPNVAGYVTIFTLSAQSVNNQVIKLKTSIGEPVYLGLKNPSNDSVEFCPSRDGLPYYDSKRGIINFNCITDQAYITYERSNYQLPRNATASLDFNIASSLAIFMDFETHELSTYSAFKPHDKNPNKISFATVRRLSNGKISVEGFKLLDEVRARNCTGIIPIAHRGLNSIAPEESLEAYSLAVRSGYNDIECDINFTKDGIPVLHHDGTINRIARNPDETGLSQTITIAEKTLEELNAYDYGIYKSKIFKGLNICKFEDIIKLGRRTGAKIHAELKQHYTDEQYQTLLDIVRKHRMSDSVGWQAFDHSSLSYIASHDESAQLELLSNDFSDSLISEGKKWTNGKRNVVLSVGGGLTQQLVDQAHAEGMDVYAWTVDNIARANQLIDMEVDGIMTNGHVDLPNLLSNQY